MVKSFSIQPTRSLVNQSRHVGFHFCLPCLMQPKLTGTSTGTACTHNSFFFLSFHRLFRRTEPSTSICTELWRHLKQSSHWNCLSSRRASAFTSLFISTAVLIFYSNKCRLPIKRFIQWGSRLFHQGEWRCWETSFPFQNLTTLSDGCVEENSAISALSRHPEQQPPRDAAGANPDPDASFQRAWWRSRSCWVQPSCPCWCSNQGRSFQPSAFTQTYGKSRDRGWWSGGCSGPVTCTSSLHRCHHWWATLEQIEA